MMDSSEDFFKILSKLSPEQRELALSMPTSTSRQIYALYQKLYSIEQKLNEIREKLDKIESALERSKD